jgi:hypothetical protein
MKTRVCARCKGLLKFRKNIVSPDYYAYCPNHYEDLYKFETVRVPRSKISRKQLNN